MFKYGEGQIAVEVQPGLRKDTTIGEEARSGATLSSLERMFRTQVTQKLDAFGVSDCGLTGDSCGQPLFSHKPGYWYKSTAQMSRDIKSSMRHHM